MKYIYRLADICLGFALLSGILAFIYILKTAGSHPNWANFCLVFLSTLTIGVMITFFFKPEIRLKISMVFFSTYICLIAVEVFIGIDFSYLKKVKAAKQSGIDFDHRSQIEAYTEFKKSDPLLYPVIFPFYVFPSNPEGLQVVSSSQPHEKVFPLGGISKSKSLFCNETGEYLFYKSDRYGFNNDDTAYNREIKILLIGDSYTNGMCVPAGEDIAGSLRKIKRNAITVGMGGNGPLLELAALKEYGPSLKPDSVIWLITEANDYIDLLLEKNNPLLMKYLQNNFNQGLIEKQAVIDQSLIDYITKSEVLFTREWATRLMASESSMLNLKKNVTLFNLRNRLGLTRYLYDIDLSETKELNPIDDERINLLKLIFNSAIKTTNEWGGKLHVVFLPAYEKIKKSDFSINKKVLTLIQELKIPIIQVSDIFSKADDPFIYFHYRLPSHYNAEGYKEIAKRINQHLSTNLN